MIVGDYANQKSVLSSHLVYRNCAGSIYIVSGYSFTYIVGRFQVTKYKFAPVPFQGLARHKIRFKPYPKMFNYIPKDGGRTARLFHFFCTH